MTIYLLVETSYSEHYYRTFKTYEDALWTVRDIVKAKGWKQTDQDFWNHYGTYRTLHIISQKVEVYHGHVKEKV